MEKYELHKETQTIERLSYHPAPTPPGQISQIIEAGGLAPLETAPKF